MSTKTNFKRVALVAVAALGLGVLSSIAPANAAAGDGDFTFTGLGLLGSVTTGASTTQTATLLTTGSLTFTPDAVGAYYVVSAGGAISSSSGTVSTGQGISSDQKKYTSGHATDNRFTVVPTGAAGSTFTVTGYEDNTNGVVTDVLTVSIAGTSEYGVASAAKSYLAWVTADGDAATADVAGKSKTTYTNGLFLNIQLNDAYGNDITSGTGALVATVTDGATVAIGAAGAAVGTAGTYTQAVSNVNPSDINLLIKEKTAGTGWNGTVTVTYNGVVIGTKSGKITGAPGSILVAPVKINKPDAAANVTWAFYVKDAAGNELTTTATTLTMSSSSDKSVISAAAGSVNSNASLDADTEGYGTTTCQKAGSSKVVMQISTNGNVVKSNEMTILCGGPAYSYSASLDKASYVQGEIAKLTVTFKDAAGNLANSFTKTDVCANADKSTDAFISAPMLSPVGSGSLFVDTSTISPAQTSCGIYPGKAGTKVYTFTVGTATGLTEGAYNAVVSYPTVDAAASVAYKVTTGSTGVSNADVLKAIVSLIASINKQIAALQKALLKK